jgi:hypothetical protein
VEEVIMCQATAAREPLPGEVWWFTCRTKWGPPREHICSGRSCMKVLGPGADGRQRFLTGYHAEEHRGECGATRAQDERALSLPSATQVAAQAAPVEAAP